jgi:hypothetical protein
MSAAVSFSDGDPWFISSRGWREIVAKTLAVLAESEDRDAVNEMQSYGVSFRRMSDGTRLVMAAAMLRAAIEPQNELAPEEGWNTGARAVFPGSRSKARA